jgi:endogenous inhibitor of DNA gyrase (YacG/DUF329 family)
MSDSTPNITPECEVREVRCPTCKKPAHLALTSPSAFCLNEDCHVIVIDLNSPASSGEALSNDFIAQSLANTTAEKHRAVWTLIGRDAEKYDREAKSDG